MKKQLIHCLAAALLLCTGLIAFKPKDKMKEHNTLTAQEKKEGWKLLFDGQTTQGWRSLNNTTFPEKGWVVQNGTLAYLGSQGVEANRGGDIITIETYQNFDLRVDWKLSEGGNSGIKYFITAGSPIGPEYQILDDDKHPDAKLRDGRRTVASLYDLIAASPDKDPEPIGEWNHSRIVAKGKHVEHWLNGKKVVEYERGSDAFRQMVADSKYKDKPNFGEATQGHILLQDHNDPVKFRNIKIKVLKP